jgi:hypothetical protein
VSAVLRLAGSLGFGVAVAAASGVGCSAPSAAELGETRPASLLHGEPVARGAFPNVVWLDSGCTGTLVHPRVVVYAAHCGLDQRAAGFGEEWFGDPRDGRPLTRAGVRSLPILGCHGYPNGGVSTGSDLAFCVLGEPASDVPFAPIIGGCELGEIRPGSELTLVGYGAREPGGAIGVKRQLSAELLAVDDARREFVIGGDGVGTCGADSGGPAFAALGAEQPDGARAWRLLGVLSSGDAGSDCTSSASYYTQLSPFVPWLEETSGVDLSPCFDEDTWAPNPDCRDPELSLLGGSETTQGPAAPAQTCGPPRLEQAPDDAPPALRITFSETGVDHTGATWIVIAAETADGGGAGVRDVAFQLWGQDGFGQSILDGSPPYTLGPVPLSAQRYGIVVTALDYAGNVAERWLAFDVRDRQVSSAGSARAPSCRLQLGSNLPSAAPWVAGALAVAAGAVVRRSGARRS